MDSGSCSEYSRSVDLSQAHLLHDGHSEKQRSHAHNSRRRVILKNGQTNLVTKNVTRRRIRLLQSFFTTLVDMRWRWILLVVTALFFGSWVAFAGVWWLIALVHGDLEPPQQEWTPCVAGIHDLTSAFLFSMENQHTTGFGSRIPTEECPEAIFLLCIQAIFGVIFQTALVGVVLAKLSRPKQRQNTLLFSRRAVVCRRDGHLCLMLRIGDVQKSHLINATVRLQFVEAASHPVDEVLTPVRGELAVNPSLKSFVFRWPEVVVHRIDQDSPLYDFSAQDLLHARLEIVATIEGTLDATDQRIQAMTSYLPQDILWGHRFHPIISYNKEVASYEVDFQLFDSVYPVDTPMCSARELACFQEEFLYRSRQEIMDSTDNLCRVGSTAATI